MPSLLCHSDQAEVTNLQCPTAIKGLKELLVMCPPGKFYNLTTEDVFILEYKYLHDLFQSL